MTAAGSPHFTHRLMDTLNSSVTGLLNQAAARKIKHFSWVCQRLSTKNGTTTSARSLAQLNQTDPSLISLAAAV